MTKKITKSRKGNEEIKREKAKKLKESKLKDIEEEGNRDRC